MRKSAFGMNGSFTFSFMPPQYTQSLCAALLAYYLSAVFGASFPVAGQRNIPCSSVFLCYHFGSKRCANNKLYCPTSFVTVVTFLLHFTEKVFLISNVTDNILLISQNSCNPNLRISLGIMYLKGKYKYLEKNY